jgi:hypothetical protein
MFYEINWETIYSGFQLIGAIFEPAFRRNISAPYSAPKISQAGNQHVADGYALLDVEDGGDTFFRNVGSHTDYAALYIRRWRN